MRHAIHLLALLCALALIVMLCGCGGSGGVGGPSVDAAGKPSKPPPPEPTPDRIAFDRWVGKRNAKPQVHVMDRNGNGVTQLTSDGANQLPSWNGDRSRLCFQSSRDGWARVYTMDAGGANQTRATGLVSAYDDSPDWCPAADKPNQIAFHRWNTEDSDYGIYVIDLNNGVGSETRVSGTIAGDMRPSWSADGNLIAFENSGRSPGGIWVVPAAGGQFTFVVAGHWPDWSPDATKIAYYSAGCIYYVPVNPETGAPDGTPVPLTTSADGTAVHPTWSPNSDFVTCSLNGTVVRIDVDSREITPLAAGEYPDWSPLP